MAKKSNSKTKTKRRIREISRDIYGGSGSKRTINRHSERRYADEYGNVYILIRSLDTDPKFFEVFGPIKPNYRGLLPRLKVGGKDSWGDNISWPKAIQAFCDQIGAVIVG